MGFLDLYKEENKNLLYCMSWLNKNLIFDKSIGTFKDIDLFTFLENINEFDYEKDTCFDDVYYILEYTQDSILHLINNINKEIKREHKIVPISQAKEFDKKSVLWISRQNGRTLKEKLSNGKIKSVQRYKNIDTYENRIFKKFLQKILEIYEVRNDIDRFEQLFLKIRRWLRSEDAQSIDEYAKVIYNNVLLHHPRYSKVFKSYKWLHGLDDKLNRYRDLYIEHIKEIIKFEVLTQLQFKTSLPLIPRSLNYKMESFEFDFKNPLLNIEIDKMLEVTYKKYVQEKQELRSIGSFVDKELKSMKTTNRTVAIDTKESSQNVFIDLFRVFPIARVNNQTITFPIMIKQKVDNKVINANNTKVIDLNHEIYTLPEVLDTFDTSTLKYFLEDISKFFNKPKLNYIIPDYVNVFDFTDSKRLINSYFKQNKPTPKSILAGLQYLFSSNVQADDTLIYIQRSHHDDLYVTPLLVKYDEKLKDITKGYYLERYPTKKIHSVDDGLLDLLSDVFEKEVARKLLSKFLQNGLKGIKNRKIVFHQDVSVLDLNDFEIPTSVYDDTEKIKKLFNSKNLFKTNYVYLNDTNEDNLLNFQQLLQYEKHGYHLWRDNLPDLSMEIIKNGIYEQFILVDETSEVIEKTVKVNNHFLIPQGVEELSFPLTFGDEKINYKAYLSSKDFPYNKDVECQLSLTYDYERETPYELTFKPINKEYLDINVKWKQQIYKDIELPIPNFPAKKMWEEFVKDPKRDGSGYSDLLEWILERLMLLENIQKIPQFFIENEQKKKEGYFENWGGKDRNNKPYCFVNVNGQSIFCHSNFFQYKNYDFNDVERGDKVYLDIEYNNIKDNYIGKNIVFASNMEECIELLNKNYDQKTIEQKLKPVVKAIRSIRYPLLKVWNNHSLNDMDVPDNFKKSILMYIDVSLKYIGDNNLPIEFKKELFNFLSHIHQDMPIQIANTLVQYSKDLQESNNLSVSIGNCDLDWQNEIFSNIIANIDEDKYKSRVLQVLAISLWRSEKLIYKLSENEIKKILNITKYYLKMRFKNIQKKFSIQELNSLIQYIELLLALLRGRKKFQLLLPSDKYTIQYIELVDDIIQYFIDNNVDLKTRIKLDIVKPESFSKTPDLLYALRVYLTADTGITNSIKVLGVSDD